VNARTPQTYAAGALLANGARLTEIYDHYVMLERDGHSARLYLQGEAQPANQAQVGLTTVGGTPPAPDAQVTSPDALTRYVRPSPVFVGNRLHGYALYSGQQPAYFERLGLQPGDVLTSINGAPVSSADEALSALETLTEGAALAVVVERQGVSQNLSLDGSVLSQPIVQEKYSVQNSKNSTTTF
jgi:general secretion pathway protein C